MMNGRVSSPALPDLRPALRLAGPARLLGGLQERRAARAAVRTENLVRGFDQQGCFPGRSAVMITDHVPAVRVPPDHAGRRVRLSRREEAWKDRGNPDPAPADRRPAAAAAAPAEAELGGPGPARRDTESAAP